MASGALVLVKPTPAPRISPQPTITKSASEISGNSSSKTAICFPSWESLNPSSLEIMAILMGSRKSMMDSVCRDIMTISNSSNAQNRPLLYLALPLNRVFIANASYRMKMFGVTTILFKIFSKVQDKIINGSSSRIYIITPNYLQDFFSGYYFSFILY